MTEEIILKALDWAFKAFVVVSFFWILIAGFRNQVVIFYNKIDFWRSVLIPLLSGLLALFIHLKLEGRYESYSTEWLMSWVVMPLMGLAVTIMAIDSLILCIRHNRSVPLGLLVAIYRTGYLFGTLILMMYAMGGAQSKREPGFGEKMARLGIAAALGYEVYQLVNGKEVYRNKGWKLPQA